MNKINIFEKIKYVFLVREIFNYCNLYLPYLKKYIAGEFYCLIRNIKITHLNMHIYYFEIMNTLNRYKYLAHIIEISIILQIDLMIFQFSNTTLRMYRF